MLNTTVRVVNKAYGGIRVHMNAYGCIRMHIGGKSVHLVAHSPNSSNELRHIFLKSDRSCQNCRYLAIFIYMSVYDYLDFWYVKVGKFS